MRFRKSITIMKGVRLNLSKTGISLTAGVRGASVNIGQKGTYVNTGIPGTGLYNRERVGSQSNVTNSRSGSGKSYVDLLITVGIDDKGNYFIRDETGKEITDDSVLRKIKRTEAYKQKISELSTKFVNTRNLENQAFTSMQKHCPDIMKEEDIKEELVQLRPRIYEKKLSEKEEPSKALLARDLEAEAIREIRSILFWTVKEKRKEYVESRLQKLYDAKMEIYNREKEAFMQKEAEQEEKINKRYSEEYEFEKAELNSYLNGEQKWVEEKVDTFLGEMILPVEFSISYEYDAIKGALKVDLDLPEIEDMPTTKATSMADGKVKIKDKTQKEIKEEYLKCITGLAFFFASSFFNISTHISRILISGFTQRINKKTGKIDDDYVYSIIFERSEYKKLVPRNIDPIEAFNGFTNKISITKAFEVSTITPFTDFEVGGKN